MREIWREWESMGQYEGDLESMGEYPRERGMESIREMILRV